MKSSVNGGSLGFASAFVHAQRGIGKFNGFTLVELMVVMSIISLLVALLLPALGKARDSAQASLCMNNQHQSGLAMIYYANDWQDFALNSNVWNTNCFWAPTPALNPVTARYDNLWPDVLMFHGYLPNIVRPAPAGPLANGTGISYYFPGNPALNSISRLITAVPASNVFSCPSLAPPDAYTYAGSSPAYTGPGGATTLLSYGLRDFLDSRNTNGIFPGESIVNDYDMIRLSMLNTQVPYMMDSVYFPIVSAVNIGARQYPYVN